MNALQPLPPASPPPRRRVKSRLRQRPRTRSHQAIVTEITVKLAINGLLAGVAAIALTKLIPYNLQQREELRQLQAEVAEVQQRVDILQADLDRQLDPQQANSIMQEQSYRVDPNQRQVVWLTPSSRTADSSSDALPTEPQQAEDSSDSIVPQQTETAPDRYQTASFPDSQNPQNP
ncbi:hypothetical protein [Leptolyngbya ohadii]|uniref:slr1601 family putative cell division protein n=1 Tax=Leptolyngbya ohadii TaxID=1962290 RepID=UPI000B5A087F|nr:hypothetical protein [Leptolyngbya ohadii]